MYFRLGYKISSTVLLAKGAMVRRSATQSLYAVGVVVGAILGVRWGLDGVAAAVSLMMAANFCLLTWEACIVLGIAWPDVFRAHVPSVCLAFATSMLSLMARSIVQVFVVSPAIIGVALSLVVALAVSAVMLGELRRAGLARWPLQIKRTVGVA
jgi:hypothetical protein